ncbi:M23 family metallopeptidase [Streptomyces piniterrae]|uniref:M23 family metallopeptidase n=1 Tax=Streptomyces piniterrae TaxID=2571125 RepID=A0A4U0NJY0_9ACTN|nr:peptidoglycan DD-metalloendopeptidase family protein [Streptomyces piniterrae]TJZ50244.1 M23 family metallopeptidase [Streptomyces piniterrae]
MSAIVLIFSVVCGAFWGNSPFSAGTDAPPAGTRGRPGAYAAHPAGYVAHPGAARRVRRSAAQRLADVSFAVMRLGEAARRTGRLYAQQRSAAWAQRVERDRLQTALRRERRTAAALRRTVGAIAGAQYRTGSIVAYTLRITGSGAGKSLVRAHEQADRRERALAARARSAGRESRVLAGESATATARAAALTDRSDRLKTAREQAKRGLGAARDELRNLATTASRSGSCGGLPHAVSSAAATVAPAAVPRGEWVRPVERYDLSAPFGGAGGHWVGRHTGQDLKVPVGTPVRSVGAGRIVSLTCGDGFGISMVVRHRRDLYSQYAHLSAALAGPGEQVRPGERIALSGDTGNSTGPHLHFEVRRTPSLGSGVDPATWLRDRGVGL